MSERKKALLKSCQDLVNKVQLMDGEIQSEIQSSFEQVEKTLELKQADFRFAQEERLQKVR